LGDGVTCGFFWVGGFRAKLFGFLYLQLLDEAVIFFDGTDFDLKMRHFALTASRFLGSIRPSLLAGGPNIILYIRRGWKA
jgi:hypothetical protein